jgi:hypothetical protein
MRLTRNQTSHEPSQRGLDTYQRPSLGSMSIAHTAQQKKSETRVYNDDKECKCGDQSEGIQRSMVIIMQKLRNETIFYLGRLDDDLVSSSRWTGRGGVCAVRMSRSKYEYEREVVKRKKIEVPSASLRTHFHGTELCGAKIVIEGSPALWNLDQLRLKPRSILDVSRRKLQL